MFSNNSVSVFNQRRLFRLPVALLVLAIFGLGTNKIASAQDAPAAAEKPKAEPAKEKPKAYVELQIYKDLIDELLTDDKAGRQKQILARKKQAANRKKILEALKGATLISDPTIQVTFDAWFKQFIFAKMTQLKTLNKIPDQRQKFIREYLERADSKEAHDHLVQLTHTQMREIAKGNFHPAARYNAMLIIGLLNSREAVSIGKQLPPEAFLKALKTMLDELSDPTQIDAVRVASMVGILRHAKLDRQKLPTTKANDRWSLQAKYAITGAMLELLKQKSPPAGRTAGGHIWMQRRAIDILAAIGDVGKDGEILNELELFITDPKAPMSIRFSAAIALGRMTVPSSMKVNVAEKVIALANLVSFACRSELERIAKEEIREQKAVGAVALGAGNPGVQANALPSALEMYQVVILRQRLKNQLSGVQDGLYGPDVSNPKGGLSSLPMSDAENKLLKDVFEHTKTLADLVDDKGLGLPELKIEMLAEVSRLDITIKKAPLPKKSTPSPVLPGAVPGGKLTPAQVVTPKKPAGETPPAKPVAAKPAPGLPKSLP